MRRALVLVAALTFMVGCGGEDPPTEGDVINKKFTPEHWEGGWEYRTVMEYDCRTESQYNYQTDSYETVEECGYEPETESYWDPHHERVGDRWELQLEDCTVEDGKEKCRKGWVAVDETTYHDYKVGAHYPDPA